jgi:hypothetical protein
MKVEESMVQRRGYVDLRGCKEQQAGDAAHQGAL